MAIVDVAVLKSTGPGHRQDREDAAAVRPALPLPHLRLPAVPEAARRQGRHRLDGYTCVAVVGGEGMSEALRELPPAVVPAVSTARSAPPTSRSTSRPRTTSRSRSAACSRSGRSSARARPARARLAADGVPVQPARLLHRDHRGRRARHLGLPGRDDRAEAPLQPPRSRAASSASGGSRALSRLGLEPADLAAEAPRPATALPLRPLGRDRRLLRRERRPRGRGGGVVLAARARRAGRLVRARPSARTRRRTRRCRSPSNSPTAAAADGCRADRRRAPRLAWPR